MEQLYDASTQEGKSETLHQRQKYREFFLGRFPPSFDHNFLLVLHISLGLGRLPGVQAGGLQLGGPVFVEYRGHRGGLVPGVEVPQVRLQDGSLVAGPGQGVEPGEGEAGRETGDRLRAGVGGVDGTLTMEILYLFLVK